MASESVEGACGRVVIYTDGACKGNPGPGGYGAVLLSGGARKELSGGYRLTTNNRMELQSLVAALEALSGSGPLSLEVYSDSQYLIGGFKKSWVKGWKRNGWLTASKEPVQNRDLWMKLDSLLAAHRFEFHWVRGHASNAENNRCDELAVRASRGRELQTDFEYESSSKRQEEARSKPAPRAERRPEGWDDDLFSSAAARGEPVNWDF